MATPRRKTLSLDKKARAAREREIWRKTAIKIADTISNMHRIPNGMDDNWRGKMVYHNYDRFKRHLENIPHGCEPTKVACMMKIQPLLDNYEHVMRKK